MQRFASPQHMRDAIIRLMAERGLDSGPCVRMLDYTIELFERSGLGIDYYGYHNIYHELEVMYMTLLAAGQGMVGLSQDDIKHLYAASLLHDFDPQKDVDKPHEENVIRFISSNKDLCGMMDAAGIDFEVVKVLILRTTYPWSEKRRESLEGDISRCFEASERARNDHKYRKHVMDMGWYLSVVDRLSGYALGDFGRSMELAKMNAHALAWPPSVIVRNAVAYFEELLNREAGMTKAILECIPKKMRMNFFDTVLSFMKLRQREITIQAEYLYESLKLVPQIETMSTRRDPDFVRTLYEIFSELPTPLQFGKDGFAESVGDNDTILNTLRLNGPGGAIAGFAKGGPLERYDIQDKTCDENYGLGNTVFLEPIALRMGYWGLKGGSEMRHLFVMQSHAAKYKYMTSFALRDIIRGRSGREEAEFVKLFDPERWDYYRVRL